MGPVEVFKKDYLERFGVSIDDVFTPIIDFYHGNRPVDIYIAKVLAAFTGTTTQYWINLQAKHDTPENKANGNG